MKRDIEHKKNHTLRFLPTDVEKWRNKATKKGMTLTRFMETTLNKTK